MFLNRKFTHEKLKLMKTTHLNPKSSNRMIVKFSLQRLLMLMIAIMMALVTFTAYSGGDDQVTLFVQK